MNSLDDVRRHAAPAGADSGPPGGVRERLRRVGAVLGRLPALQREILMLNFRNGLSYREIGKRVHLSVSNVGFLMHAALHRVREETGPPPGAGTVEPGKGGRKPGWDLSSTSKPLSGKNGAPVA